MTFSRLRDGFSIAEHINKFTEMVLETLAASIVNQVLGEYISNLQTNQLELGIFSGSVVLHNLTLKKDIFTRLRLPVEILDGCVGSLTLSIPWSDLKGKPLKIGIRDVYILAVPQGSREYDPEAEQEEELAAKQKKLHDLDQGKAASEG